MSENSNDLQKQIFEDFEKAVRKGSTDPTTERYFQYAASYLNALNSKEIADYARQSAGYVMRQAEAAESTANSTKKSVKIMMASVIVLAVSSLVSLLLQ